MVSKWQQIIRLSASLTSMARRPTGDDIWWSMWPLVSKPDISGSGPHQVKWSQDSVGNVSPEQPRGKTRIECEHHW